MSAIQKQSLTDVLQNRCQTCNFIKKRLQYRYFPMKFTLFLRAPLFWWLLLAVNSVKQWKHTLKVYAGEKERNDRLKSTSNVSVSRKRLFIWGFCKHCWLCPIFVKLQAKATSSRPEVFFKKGVLRNFTKLTGKHLCQSLFFTALGLQHY